MTYQDELTGAERRLVEASILESTQFSRHEVPSERLTLIRISDNFQDLGFTALDASDELNRLTSVVQARPTYIAGDLRITISDRIAIQAHIGSNIPWASLAERGLDILSVRNDLVLCRVPNGTDAVTLAAELSKEPWVQYAEPDLVSIGGPLPITEQTISALSMYTPQTLPQPAMQQIGANLVWKQRPGSSNVRIAILDDGIDVTHPALALNIVGKYDAISDSEIQLGNTWDWHGTACAGLVAGYNDVVGMRGVAAGCGLFMVRVAQSWAPGQPWSTSSSVIGRGIDWAVDNGADVLSNSWGGGAPSNIVIDAIARARTTGRAGRGCVVVFAAGNTGGDVLFPGTVSGVLTVSGVNSNDQFKTKTSSDGEYWWASNFGPEVSIAAPSVGLFTTDIVGSAGNSPSDYLSSFNGTSAATPLVAGAAAILISARPTLNEAQIRSILENTADKVGSISYVEGRNNAFGFGRLNVWRALESLNETAAVTGILRRPSIDGGLPIYFLERLGESPILLQVIRAHELIDPSENIERNYIAFAPFENQSVSLIYDSIDNTPYGLIAWGANLTQYADNEYPIRSHEEVPPDEIWLPEVAPKPLNNNSRN